MNRDSLLSELDQIADSLETAIWAAIAPRWFSTMSAIEQLLLAMPQESLTGWMHYRQITRARIEDALIPLNDEFYAVLVARLEAAGPTIRMLLRLYRPSDFTSPPVPPPLEDTVAVLTYSLRELFRRRSPSPFMQMLLRVIDQRVRDELMHQPFRGFGRQVFGRQGPDYRSRDRRRGTVAATSRAMLQNQIAAATWSAVNREARALWLAGPGEAWRWVTREDELVCPICRPRNLKTYPTRDEVPPWPAHPRCRCIVVLDRADDP